MHSQMKHGTVWTRSIGWRALCNMSVPPRQCIIWPVLAWRNNQIARSQEHSAWGVGACVVKNGVHFCAHTLTFPTDWMVYSRHVLFLHTLSRVRCAITLERALVWHAYTALATYCWTMRLCFYIKIRSTKTFSELPMLGRVHVPEDCVWALECFKSVHCIARTVFQVRAQKTLERRSTHRFCAGDPVSVHALCCSNIA
jgi:hypothetical protein